MNYGQIYTEVLNKLRMEAEDIEPNIEAQLKHSINEAYKLVSGKYKQIQVDYLPVIQGAVELPRGAVGTIEFAPPLDSKLDRKVGDNIITKRPDGTVFTLRYYAVPEKLIDPESEPMLPERLVEALIVYPCYVYFVTKRRLDVASAYKSQFDEIMINGDLVHDEMDETIINVYGSFFN